MIQKFDWTSSTNAHKHCSAGAGASAGGDADVTLQRRKNCRAPNTIKLIRSQTCSNIKEPIIKSTRRIEIRKKNSNADGIKPTVSY